MAAATTARGIPSTLPGIVVAFTQELASSWEHGLRGSWSEDVGAERFLDAVATALVNRLLSGMPDSPAYVLPLSQARAQELLHARSMSPTALRVSVHKFRSSRSPFMVFASFQGKRITHIANGQRGRSAETNRVQLKMQQLERLTRPIRFSEALEAVPPRVRIRLDEYLQNGGLLPPQTRKSFVDFMARTDPKVVERLDALSRLHNMLPDLSPTARENLAFEKDAVGVLLRLAKIDREVVLNWRESRFQQGAKHYYLRGLHVDEHTMIASDARTLPGFETIRRSARYHGALTFQGHGASGPITIINAHPGRLEELTGTDLIYWNHAYHSFVMVQYKAMRYERRNWTFRWREGDGFWGQITRMETLRRKIDPLRESEEHPRGYRLSSNPFFMKFCKRVAFDPANPKLFRGMYIPLDLWHRLHRSGRLLGERGGNLVTYDNIGRWLSNSKFVDMLTDSWVGTSPIQTEAVDRLISSAFAFRRGVVLGIQQP